jgi:hypothetical protein
MLLGRRNYERRSWIVLGEVLSVQDKKIIKVICPEVPGFSGRTLCRIFEKTF